MNMPLVLLNRRRRGGAAAFTPAGLFALAEPGVWYDPSDVANLAWRRNLLTFTEQFDNAVWGKLRTTVTANTATAPDGTLTADTISTATGASAGEQAVRGADTITSSRVFSIYVKKSNWRYVGIRLFNYSIFDLDTETWTLTGAGETVSAQSVGDGWYRISTTSASTGSINYGVSLHETGTALGWSTPVNGTSAYIWGAQLELGSVATDYQRISDVNTEVIERFPSATLYQDTAGTLPVTTPGQTVALALDKSKGLVLGSELVPDPSFDNAAKWSGSAGWVVSGGAATATNASSGTTVSILSGDRPVVTVGLIASVTIVIDSVTLGAVSVQFAGSTSGSFSTAGTYTVLMQASSTTGNIAVRASGTTTAVVSSLSVKELPGFHATQATLASRPTYGIVPLGGRRNLLLNTDTLATQSRTVTAAAHTLSFTGTGTITLTGASTAGPLIGTGAGNRVSLTFTPTAGSLTMTVLGSVTLAQLELGSTVTNYQRVGSAFDVTEAGVASLSYLSFDGVDDSLVTPTVSFSTDKMTVFAGVRKLSDATRGIVAETSAAASAGAWNLNAPNATTTANYAFRNVGSLSGGDAVTSSTFAAPTTNVLTAIGDIAADVSQLRVNGSVAATSAADLGTGNYAANILYIGRRAGTSLPFNGQLFSLIVRNAATDAATITSSETWVAGKTGVTL